MEDDGFTLVTGKKAAGKKSNKSFKKTENGTHIRVDGTEKDIELAMESAKFGILKSGLGKWVTQKLEILAGNRQKIQKMYLIGNGHFDRADQPGAHQLALFLEISEILKCNLVFQEPFCSKSENNWLEKQKNIEIRKEIDTKIDIGTDLSIFVIIHGEHEILNEFLAYNWTKIDNLIVIGNNYGGIDWELSKLSAGNPRINEFYEKSIITSFPEIYEPHSSAFSSTVIMSPVNDE